MYSRSGLTHCRRKTEKEEPFCKYFVNANFIENLKREIYIPLEPIPKGGIFYC